MSTQPSWSIRNGRRGSTKESRTQSLAPDLSFRHPFETSIILLIEIDRNYLERLLTLNFVKQNQNIIITGPTGVGKSYLAQAIGNHACTMLCKTVYFNTAKLMELFRAARLDGTYLRLIKKIKRSPLLILDDFGLAPFDPNSRQTLMDLVEDRHDQSSTIITSQIPVNKWHELIGEGTIADAILDRIVNSAHRISLNGKSLRKKIDQQ
jgi:DNA replication protein DnaC